MPSQNSASSVRVTLVIERELIRVTEAYNNLTKDNRWNRLVIGIIFQMIIFEMPERSD